MIVLRALTVRTEVNRPTWTGLADDFFGGPALSPDTGTLAPPSSTSTRKHREGSPDSSDRSAPRRTHRASGGDPSETRSSTPPAVTPTVTGHRNIPTCRRSAT